MNVFVLCTGRCGSLTFAKACSHLKNYSVGHETNCRLIGRSRVEFPGNHIEVDNRLSWLLGRLDDHYGDNAFYVHLVRNRDQTAKSFNKRWHMKNGIIRGYSHCVLRIDSRAIEVCEDYYDTVNANIRHFLKSKRLTMILHLEKIQEQFPIFIAAIKAEGDLKAALGEWQTRHNESNYD